MASESDHPVLVAESLTCERGGRRLFTDLGFALEPGGALLLRGPNASGKSSLLRVLAGLLDPTGGRVLWHGSDTDEDSRAWRRALAYLGHGAALKPQLTVSQNLCFWHSFESSTASVPDALETVGLAHLADLPASMLSAGQQRRLALGRLALRPGGCWLMDEPTVTLDRDSVTRLAAMIGAHRAQGGVAIIATHEELALDGAGELTLGAPS